jgi:hydrogenase/urease accessory protein HupE
MPGRFLRFWLAALLLFCLPLVGRAHDIPRSDVELRRTQDTLTGHIDAPREGLTYQLPGVTKFDAVDGERIGSYLAGRFNVTADGTSLRTIPDGYDVSTKTVRVRLRFEGNAGGTLVVGGSLFPSDPNHQTFVTVYDNDALVSEAILSRATPSLSIAAGSRQSTLDVIRQFVREGIHHIFIGPDHILFIVGLLLLGGTLKHLLKIVTAFTLAHSVTLVLATLDILNPSPRLVEPAIALSIVFVGIHTLATQGTKEVRDLRILFAGGFGLIHGFGFAGVLRELELPREALGWSLAAFNVGVEIGQACIVLAVAPLLALLHRKNEQAGRRFVVAGSWCVILAGAYWFGQRLTS